MRRSGGIRSPTPVQSVRAGAVRGPPSADHATDRADAYWRQSATRCCHRHAAPPEQRSPDHHQSHAGRSGARYRQARPRARPTGYINASARLTPLPTPNRRIRRTPDKPPTVARPAIDASRTDPPDQSRHSSDGYLSKASRHKTGQTSSSVGLPAAALSHSGSSRPWAFSMM